MKTLVFATNNPDKIKEVKELLGEAYNFLSLKDVGCLEEIPETQATIEGNAVQKAEYLHHNYKYDCFSEDTGLEVKALNGAPGVITAHYAGPQRSATDNMNKLLEELAPHADRSARFKTVIALIMNGETHLFEGIVEGTIAETVYGAGGFGYDPIFIPKGYSTTFAEMSADAKNAISHRGRAIAKLQAFLKK
ncbi:MAG: non-canonical purine NTP diphosphatase [Bacteroidota bacterium]